MDAAPAPATEAGAPPGAAAREPSAELIERLQRVIARVERIADPADRAVATELIGGVVELYGEGLARIGKALAEAGPAGESIKRALVEDGVVGSLLLIHDLHPVPVERRVREALDEVSAYVDQQGGRIADVSFDGGVARVTLLSLRIPGAAARSTLESAVAQAVARRAPDLQGIEFEGASSNAGVAEERAGFVPLATVGGLRSSANDAE